MKKATKKRAHALYKEHFTKAALKKTYEHKISSSQAVGNDGVGQKTFKSKLDAELDLILKKVEACSYRFTSYKPKLISKGPYRPPRVLSIPTIRDRLTLRTINNILSQVFSEAQIWRPHVYIKDIKSYFANPSDNMAFTRIDIKNFYPSIDHEIMMRKLRSKIRKPQLVHLIRSAISTPTSGVKNTTIGVPQGLSVSNILASIYLYQMDRKFKEKYTYFRYVDDILVICRAEDAESVFNEIKAEIAALKLMCHELGYHGKSQISSVAEGIEYLGFHITPTRISVRESSYTRMIENLLAVLTGYKHAPDKKKNEKQLVWRLNLKITGCIYNNNRYGWVFFFSQIDDLRQLARLDEFVTRELENRGLKHLRQSVKKFLRGYHEIRLNLSGTKYIPKFDELEISGIINELSQAEGYPTEHYTSELTEGQIRQRFTRLINRQTRMLEKDLVEALS